MKSKKIYSSPGIEEFMIDKVISLEFGSPITPPASAPQSDTPVNPAGPQFENPAAAEYPFGGEGPDFSNL